MDGTTDFLSDYAGRLTFGDLTPEAVHQVKRTLIDTLGCAAGAFDGEPAAIARAIASRVRGNPPARVLGTRSEEHTSELQSLTNLVCRLLLEKKKKKKKKKTNKHQRNAKLEPEIYTSVKYSRQ